MTFFYFLLALGIYLLPSIISSLRDHPNENSILVLNLFLGWTVLGWIAALIWSATAIEKKPLQRSTSDSQRVPCPFCAEPILPAANVCKHCGNTIDHTGGHSQNSSEIRDSPTEIALMEHHGITHDGEHYVFGAYKYDRLEDAVNYARRSK